MVLEKRDLLKIKSQILLNLIAMAMVCVCVCVVMGVITKHEVFCPLYFIMTSLSSEMDANL